jgi:hypothetical protein
MTTMQQRITITAFARSRQRSPLVCLLTFLVAAGAPTRAATMYAASPTEAASVSGVKTVDQFQSDQFCHSGTPCLPPAPPPLLNLDQALYAATAEQEVALRNLEAKAIANVIAIHGLTQGDTSAVQTWGRNDALAQLFGILMSAIGKADDKRTADEQKAVEWLSGIAQRKAVAAAQSAAREYVKWAGLNSSAFEILLASNPSRSQLSDFLDDAPQPTGWCAYRSPDPYSTEYAGYTDRTCLAPCSAVLGCNPPTPSYDQFVKWGQARESYSFLNSVQFARTAQNVGNAVLVSVGVAAFIAGSVSAPLLVFAPEAAAAAAAALAEEEIALSAAASLVSPWGTVGLVASVAAVAAVLVVALSIAIVQGIAVINASSLPGQLADLINSAETTVPDLRTAKTTTDGGTSLFAIFVGATLPEPINETCDNSSTTRGITLLHGTATVIGAPPCLNPSAIPAASPTDPQFEVQQEGTPRPTVSPTITYQDVASGTTTTARLSESWLITDMNGVTGQTLRLAYTDWNGRLQNAWVLGNQTHGYRFFNFTLPANSSTAIDATTCVQQAICSESNTLRYIGGDGNRYSARVRGYQPPTGAPSVSTAVEGSPVSFDAHGFAPGAAKGAIIYQWRFQKDGCGFKSCGTASLENGQFVFHPDYESPVPGAMVTHTWRQSGTFSVQLTAIDQIGATGTTTIQVAVGNVPPTLTLQSGCPPPVPWGIPPSICDMRTANNGTPIRVSGWFNDVGALSNLTAYVYWGDGRYNWNQIGPNVSPTGSLPVSVGFKRYTFDGSHTYDAPGTYYGVVSVYDGSAFEQFVGLGGSDSETFVITIHGLPQTISFPAIAARSYGDAPIPISATGAASGSPVTFAVTGASSVCAVTQSGSSSNTGTATLALLEAGVCTITADQAGNAQYDPAPPVTQSFTINRAPLTITASSPTITYGAAVPAITPSYSGFVGGESAASLDTQPTCSVAPTGGAAGSYSTSCSGAVDPNYDVSFMNGTLTINKATTALSLGSTPASPVKGQPVAFTATVGISSPGATNPGGTVNFDDGAATIAGCTGVPVSPTTKTAVCSTSALTVGAHSVTAAYSGDTNFKESSTSSALTKTVSKAATTTTVGMTTPSISGQPVTFTATVGVIAPGAGSPTGTVAFFDGTMHLGTQPLSIVGANVQATFNTSALTVGRHSITASYGGSGDFVKSTSTAVIQYVNTDLSGYPKLPSGAYDLTGADLRGADLVGASLGGARLSGANLEGANLTDAVLAGADFSGAKLERVNFTRANLTGARFHNANLRGATGLETATLTGAVWSETICPNGKNSNAVGGTCVREW